MNHPFLRLSLLAFVPLACLAAQDKPDLHVGAKKGDKQLFRQTSKATQSIDMGGQQMESGSAITQVFEIEITAAAGDGSLEGTMKVVRTKGNFTVPMGEEVAFDSAGSDDNDDGMGIGQALTTFAGKTFGIRVARHGEVIEIKGAAEALAEARGKTNGMGAQMLGGQLNEVSLKQLAQAAFGQMPAKAVAIGETFPREQASKARNLGIVSNLDYTLAKADDKQVEMMIVGTMSTPKPEAGSKEPAASTGDPDVNSMLKGMKIGKSKITGKDVFARDTGFMIESARKIEMSMTMPSPMGDGEFQIDSVNEVATARATEADVKPQKKPAEPKKDEPKKEPAKGG